MSPEAQRIAIAEACGWIQRSNNNPSGKRYWNAPDGGFAAEQEIPDYTNDLNAMHEAEKILTDSQRHAYGEYITKVVPSPHGYGFHLYVKYPWSGDDVYALVHATAAQRAEAFLRTLGLWSTPAAKE